MGRKRKTGTNGTEAAVEEMATVAEATPKPKVSRSPRLTIYMVIGESPDGKQLDVVRMVPTRRRAERFVEENAGLISRQYGRVILFKARPVGPNG